MRDDTAEALLPSLRDRFQAAQPRRIPAVYYDFAHPPPSRAVDAGGPADDVDRIGEALLWISSQLSAGPNSAAGRIRFRKLGLVLALLAMDLSDRGADSDVVLRDRQLDRGPFLGEPLPQIVEPALPNWVTAILRLFPPVWFTARISGRIP